MYDDLKQDLYAVFMSLKRHKHRLFDTHCLSVPEFRILHSIRNGEGHESCELHVSGIGKRLSMSMPSVSQILNSLEKKGYITRSIGEDDRRKIRVVVTAEGEAALCSAMAYNDRVMETMADRMGEQDARELVRLAIKLSGILDELKEDEVQKAGGKDMP